MTTTGYWIDSAAITEYPAVRQPLTVDVLVIGGGVTGITAAYVLQEAGLRIALIARARLAMIDTGHTTAHLTYVTDRRLRDLVKQGSATQARAVWEAGAAAVATIEQLVGTLRIDCDFERLPGFLHAPPGVDPAADRPSLQHDAELAQELGFDVTDCDAVPVYEMPGARFANQAKLHPRKYLGRLVDAMAAGGVEIFERSAAGEFDAPGRRVKVNGHWINFDRVVIATNNPLVGMASMRKAALFQTRLALYSSYVIGAKVPRGALPQALWWDTSETYDYMRVDRGADHDYVIIGGEDHKTGQVADTKACWDRLARRLEALVPHVEVDRRWSGQVIETSDGLPFIGENAAGQFIATGYCGNGITFGTNAALMARDWAMGADNQWRKLFAVDRKRVGGGAWRDVRENSDFPVHFVKDRLTNAAPSSVRRLPPGSGMIVRSQGKKVAAYRDPNGKLHKVSAACTHLGCLVRWNPAESTWDCPCHGSRFEPSGEVIAGPAEDPLGPV